MKRTIFILALLSSISVYASAQVEVNFSHNKTNPNAYFTVMISNTSSKSILIKNMDYLTKKGSNINFVVFDSNDSFVGQFQYLFTKEKYFIIKPNEVKIIEYSRKAVMGYKTSTTSISSFNAIIHLEYLFPFEYPNVEPIQNKVYDLDESFLF